jgi:hypothetical protein
VRDYVRRHGFLQCQIRLQKRILGPNTEKKLF